MTNLNNVLFEASVAPITYDSFTITDYIDNDYFETDGIDSIVASVGTTKLEYENGIPKVIWDIKNLRSESQAKLTIDVNLKDEYLNKGGLYPTNKKEEVNAEIDKIKEEITSTKTPVLADNYKVIYDGNAPSNCTVQNVPSSITKSVFETVEINNSVPVCEGYQFKGWSIVTENVKKVNEDYFIMPESDVVIRANWGKMSIAKNIDGEVFTVQTLYNIVEKQASLDNTKSEFVNSSSGINFDSAPSNTNGKGVYTIASTKDYEYPVHYFRGEVTNNNVKFANFCWKIVRTTETGGVKLIYNGEPDENGGCTNTTGTSTQIGTSAFNSSSASPADVGYMYGTRYEYSSTDLGSSYWYTLFGKTRLSKSSMSATEYYYGDSVTYDASTNTYTLNNSTKYLWSSNYSSLKRKYTCFKDTEEGCETVSYLDSTSSSSAYYVNMVSGETYESLVEQANNVKWIYGKDVEYVNGTYKLVDSVEAFPMNWQEDYKTFVNAHHYTCYTTSDSCTDVKYIYYGTSSKAYYMTLKEGKKIDDILTEMTTESSNTTNSKIKTKIDDWYSKNMIDYTDRLEDTIWCNDRSISQKGGWDKDSTTSGYLYFGARGRNYSTYKPSIECPNANDKFTVSSEAGNGKLTYPVALLTADEATLAGHGTNGSNKSYLYTGQWWWALSPSFFNVNFVYEFYVYSSLGSIGGSNAYGVRPSVSLAPGTMISDGNGTSNFPFEIL